MPTLDWLGKQAVVNHHREVPFHLLKQNHSLSVGEPDSGNLLIEGDNLLALKALLPYYAGKVKCIYIDPPYNTGNENWVYNDNVNSPVIQEWLGKVVGKEAEDLSRHDKWLCMMYPRLVLLRELLCEDGVIFVSIDDNEVAHLRLVLDEIFGARDFITNIVWQKKYSPQSDATYFSDMHDHILVYARRAKNSKKDSIGWERQLLPRTVAQEARYKNPDNDLRGVWKAGDLSVKTYSAAYDYPITTPSGRVVHPPKGRCWATSRERVEELTADNRVWFGKDGNNVPSIKRFLSEVQGGRVPVTWWTREDCGDNQEAKQDLKKTMQGIEKVFDTPKPVRLIERILQIATKPSDIILDSFSGSGTTGHAVMQLNKTDGGKRRFILVEMEPEVCRLITAERLRRVIEGYTWEDQRGNQRHEFGLGRGFSYYEIGEPLFDAQGFRQEIPFEDVARYVFFTETGAPMPESANGQTPFLGCANGVGVYLLYGGVLGNGENALTRAVMNRLPPHDGPKVIYGTSCRISATTLKREGITFRQIPYDVRRV